MDHPASCDWSSRPAANTLCPSCRAEVSDVHWDFGPYFAAYVWPKDVVAIQLSKANQPRPIKAVMDIQLKTFAELNLLLLSSEP